MLKENVLDILFDKLDNSINQEVNINYCGDELFQEESDNGTITFSHGEAKKWIINHFDELGSVIHEMNLNKYRGYSRATINPFYYPEEYQVEIIAYLTTKYIRYATAILGIDDNTITLSEQMVQDIKGVWDK